MANDDIVASAGEVATRDGRKLADSPTRNGLRLVCVDRPGIGQCAECFAHGSDGLVRDAELLYRRWAFDVRRVERAGHFVAVGAGDEIFAIAAKELGTS
jgi:hypothetical protein